MKFTFHGGVHPEGHKDLSRDVPLRLFDPKGEMVYPLSQHIGKPARPIVKKGDSILVGQRIAEADGFVSAHIYSSCSGTVKAIEKRRTLFGQLQESIVIDNDGQFTPAGDFTTRRDISGITNEEILKRIKDAAIVGLGGAGFPTHIKLMPTKPESIRFCIANGAECEPYLTCNDQLMRMYPDEIVEGLELVLRLFPNAQGVIGIEDNKPEAIAAMTKAAEGKEKIKVLTVKAKYPQGSERSLIKVVSGIDIPGTMLPAGVGCIISNVGSLYAIQRAVCYEEPLYSHCLTVSGDAVQNPGNFIVRDGTSFAELLEASGGLKEGVTLKKALAGGPMMGIAFGSLDVPVHKSTNGLTLLAEDAAEKAAENMTACLRCGRCATVCPAGLVPQRMAEAIISKDFDYFENELHGLECFQCGSCTYICPAGRPLMQEFKRAKSESMIAKRAKKEGGKS